MANFSKQWCDINDPEMPYDFDIEEVAGSLQAGYAVPEICEGFGFSFVGKGHEGKTILGFLNDQDEMDWVDYQEFIANEKKQYL